MLTFEDCIALSDLTQEEIEAIAEHDHIPEMLALEFGHYLIELPDGERRVRRLILDDIEIAQRSCHFTHSAKLKLVLKHFIETHPGADARAAPRAATGNSRHSA